ncbi:DCST2 [Bugula neritina]|uniref:DCST2 n=1 Tax=Bugula neritina TaxID=10212 RepID=A0A7J7JW63_BUGNE|nr:DCST2 [Bugula neritina]
MPLLRPILNALGYAQKYCIGCGQAGPVKDMENFIHCRNYGCKAIYCKTCTNDLKNTCTECNKPIDFSFVEVDEELDSSDEEAEGEKQKVKETPEQKKLKTVQQQGDILKRLLVIQKEKQLAVTGEVV